LPERSAIKEWYQDSKAKKGKKRQELDVDKCFAPLLSWILSLWNAERLWLAMAVATLWVVTINIIADLLCGKGISLNGLFPSSFIFNTS
jgi:hypothetical protein